MLKYYSEFLGTFLLVSALGLSGDPLIAGLAFALLIYISADLSGAHFNPAVTLAAWAADEIPARLVGFYLLFQAAGALLAAFFVWWISGATFLSQPAPSTGIAQFAVLEWLFSFFFITVFLCLVYPAKKRRNPLFGLIAGLGFALCLSISEAYSGYGLNPAMSLSFIAADTVNHGYTYYHLPVYLLSPLIGGVTAAWVYRRIVSFLAN
jgi:glycerol uptake facilitator-like aquaporin